MVKMILLALNTEYLSDKAIVSKKNTYVTALKTNEFAENTYVKKLQKTLLRDVVEAVKHI